MNLSKLETLEAIALVSIIMVNKIILNLPKNIISSTGSSAWLNTLIISIIATIFAFLIVKLFKKFPGFDILDVSDYLGKKFLKIIIGILYIILFLFVAILILRSFSESLKVIYFNSSPIIFLMLFFIVSACIANKFGIKVIAKTNLIITPIVLLSILVILFCTSKNFVFQRLLPIFGYGINETFFSGLTNLFAFTGIAYLFFLQPFLKKQKDFKKISIISMIISGIYLFLSVTCLLLVFPFITESDENISVFLLTKMVKYGEFIQRISALFIFIWILSVISYISISLFFAIYVTKKITNISDTNAINYCFSSIILGGALLIENYSQYIYSIANIFNYSSLIYLFGINFLILIFANIKQKIINKKRVYLYEKNC